MKFSSYDQNAIEQCRAETDRLVVLCSKWIGEWFKKYHGIQQSDSYWLTVFVGALKVVVPAIIDINRRDSNQQDYDEGDSDLSGREWHISAGLSSLMVMLREQETLNSRMLEAAALLVESKTEPNWKVCGTTLNKPRSYRIAWLFRILYLLRKPEVILLHCPISKKDLLGVWLQTLGRVGTAPISIDSTPLTPDYQLRQDLAAAAGDQATSCIGDPVFALLLRYLPVLLPLDTLEGYLERRAHLASLADVYCPRRIVSGYGIYFDQVFAIWVAECRARGARYWGWQHGGTYGEAIPTTSERLERAIGDKFVSWGWDDGKGDIIALPTPRGSLKPGSRSRKDGQILWVTTADSPNVYFIDHVLFGTQFYDYFKHQRNLYQKLSESVRLRMRVRLYRLDFGWELKKRWSVAFPKVQFADLAEPLVSQISNADFVVIDHAFSTTFLECLTLGVPAIVCAPPEFRKPRESAAPFYDAMLDQGVFAKDVNTAAGVINQHLGSYMGWWDEPERQAVISMYRRSFCRPSHNRVAEWAEVFNMKLDP